MARSWLVLFVVACGARTSAPPPTLGNLRWHAHWEVVGDTLYGIALDAQGGFEVNIIDDSDEQGAPAPLALVSLANGRDPMRLSLRAATPAQPVHGTYATVWKRQADGTWAVLFDIGRVANVRAPAHT